MGRLVEVADTKLYVEERGEPSGFPLLVFHGAALQEYLRRTTGLARYAPDVIRHFASQDYGGIDLENRLGEVTHPVLVLGGRHDGTCAVGASQDMARRLPNAELVVFEDSAHMMFAEEQDSFLAKVRQFLDRITG
jgi:pimeloyl-ACP methyl ester carboxylesterase